MKWTFVLLLLVSFNSYAESMFNRAIVTQFEFTPPRYAAGSMGTITVRKNIKIMMDLEVTVSVESAAGTEEFVLSFPEGIVTASQVFVLPNLCSQVGPRQVRARISLVEFADGTIVPSSEQSSFPNEAIVEQECPSLNIYSRDGTVVQRLGLYFPNWSDNAKPTYYKVPGLPVRR